MDNFLRSQASAGLSSALTGFTHKMKEEEAMSQARDFGLPYIDLVNFPIDLNVLGMMTVDEARESQSVIFYKDLSDLRVATLNPNNQLLIQKLEELSEKNQISLYIISTVSFDSVLKLYEKVSRKVVQKDDTIRSEVEQLEGLFKSLQDPDIQSRTSITDLVNALFGRAAELGASDIHVEPEAESVKIRFRIDGVLQEVLKLKKELQKGLISRLKISGKLKINVDNLPQDGRLTFYFNDEPLDVRISSIPTAFGESFVMRLLSTKGLAVDITSLGLVGNAWEVVQRQLAKPNGMIITTGPTGSGKTTTLYSFIKELNKPGVKIITIEDPVEYKLEGISQTPIDHNVDFSFAKALRAILRQDPDIVMVGEIRDEETADTAAQAALTGHIVLSTLHTNDAAGAVPRMYNMGVKPYVLAPALNCIIAQRLVRKLCQSCKVKDESVDAALIEKTKKILSTLSPKSGRVVPPEISFSIAKGCSACNNLGYKGRIGIFEVIEVDDVMEDFIQKQPSMVEIKQKAFEAGMVTLLQDGLLKAIEGLTDIKEVFRVAGE